MKNYENKDLSLLLKEMEERVKHTRRELRGQMEGLSNDMLRGIKLIDGGGTPNEIGEAQRAAQVNRLCAVLFQQREFMEKLRNII